MSWSQSLLQSTRYGLPTEAEAKDLKVCFFVLLSVNWVFPVSQDNFAGQCKKAAQAIAAADILIVSTGAGYSAESGLAVYKDIADVPAYHKRRITCRHSEGPRVNADCPVFQTWTFASRSG